MNSMKSVLISLVSCFVIAGCDNHPSVMSTSGVSKASVKIETGPDGLTVEQRNVHDRLKLDNTVGSIKHLYLTSSITGKPFFYATVKGKITSGNKRLTPSTVVLGQLNMSDGFSITINGNSFMTTEVMQDDGTYGSSQDYVYFWDQKDQYHQLMVGSCNCIIHVSDRPIDFTEQALLFEMASQEKQVQKK